MALSDPVNVRLGLLRKQQILQRLAQQMAARGAGGRAQGTGAQFQSAVNLRTGGPARTVLPFALPVNRARPAGFDPSTDVNPWAAPQAVAPVINSGPPAGAGGGTPVADPTPPQQAPGSPDPVVGYTPPSQGTGARTPLYAAPNSPTGQDVDPGFWVDQSAPLNQPAPDPYTLMATQQLQRIIRAGTRVAV